MKPYKATYIRRWHLVAMALRGLEKLTRYLPLLLVAVFLLLPVGPHLRVEYSYKARGSSKYMTECKYLGSRGYINHIPDRSRCPVVIIIDRRVVSGP